MTTNLTLTTETTFGTAYIVNGIVVLHSDTLDSVHVQTVMTQENWNALVQIWENTDLQNLRGTLAVALWATESNYADANKVHASNTLRDVFFTWCNDYLTVEKFSDDLVIPMKVALELIDAGRKADAVAHGYSVA